MRKLLSTLVLLLSPLPMFATFGTATAWDVRTTGADTNGGAFDSGVGAPGTDESQGSGTAITITLTGTTAGSGSPAFTSTTHGPGNFVYIASGSGCTIGWYEVLSQTAGVATFDHAMGTTTNICVGVIGGSLSSPITAMNTVISQNTVWVQTGTYTLTTSGLINNANNPAIVYVTGYGSTHGDGGTAPLITTATNSIDLIRLDAGNYWFFNNLSLSNTAGTRGFGIAQYTGGGGLNLFCFRCIFDGLLNAINGDFGGARGVFTTVWIAETEVKNSTASQTINLSSLSSASSLFVVNSYFHGNTGITIQASNNYQTYVGNIFSSGSQGIFATGGIYVQLYNNSFTGYTTQAVNLNVGGVNPYSSQNNIFYGNTGSAFNTASSPSIPQFNQYNAFGGNTTNGTVGSNSITLTGNPWTNSASGDFSLNATAGAGAALKGAGYPGVFPGGTSTGHPDIGAIQSAAGAGGGASNFGSSN